MVVCGIAVIGKENNPLYIRAWGEYDTLRFHFICHVALDFVEEKGARARSLRRVAAPLSLSLSRIARAVAAQRQQATQQQAAGSSAAGQQPAKYDGYLGFLYPIEEMKVFGFLTNCRIKLVAVIDDEEWKEDQMKALLRRLHTLYVDTVSNPFHEPDSELYKCANFVRQVERIVEAGLY